MRSAQEQAQTRAVHTLEISTRKQKACLCNADWRRQQSHLCLFPRYPHCRNQQDKDKHRHKKNLYSCVVHISSMFSLGFSCARACSCAFSYSCFTSVSQASLEVNQSILAQVTCLVIVFLLRDRSFFMAGLGLKRKYFPIIFFIQPGLGAFLSMYKEVFENLARCTDLTQRLKGLARC